MMIFARTPDVAVGGYDSRLTLAGNGLLALLGTLDVGLTSEAAVAVRMRPKDYGYPLEAAVAELLSLGYLKRIYGTDEWPLTIAGVRLDTDDEDTLLVARAPEQYPAGD